MLEKLRKTTLADIVTNNIRSAIIFEELRLDFCCKGRRTLEEACAGKKLDVKKVVDELVNLANCERDDQKVNTMELNSLIDHIVDNHHQYVRRITPVISAHSDKVVSVHGENHPETVQIADLFLAVRDELESHMMKEERILFPYIKQMVHAREKSEQCYPTHFGTIGNPISIMELEHVSAGESFDKIRELSGNYSVSGKACNTFKALYSELKEFEEDLHRHIHLENNILFPRSIELEHKLLQKGFV
ncbi:MAG: iron-sulfur cluster repair di-iron protein [Deltaproteobacteria bacterium RIFCSPHIGHO2_12_FULL_43_9]|nr:MAG: iron-sulfur cluster repair di-iron protein [Deltaproteobacteria bacterium RIFCSPHIGHO2_12_FULL_43_9]